MAEAEVGVFGGSGFYALLDDVEEVWVDTPYGPTSDRIVVGEVGGRRVAFLPRHGRTHPRSGRHVLRRPGDDARGGRRPVLPRAAPAARGHGARAGLRRPRRRH